MKENFAKHLLYCWSSLYGTGLQIPILNAKIETARTLEAITDEEADDLIDGFIDGENSASEGKPVSFQMVRDYINQVLGT